VPSGGVKIDIIKFIFSFEMMDNIDRVIDEDDVMEFANIVQSESAYIVLLYLLEIRPLLKPECLEFVYRHDVLIKCLDGFPFDMIDTNKHDPNDIQNMISVVVDGKLCSAIDILWCIDDTIIGAWLIKKYKLKLPKNMLMNFNLWMLIPLVYAYFDHADFDVAFHRLFRFNGDVAFEEMIFRRYGSKN
jgi:hypothetical protein